MVETTGKTTGLTGVHDSMRVNSKESRGWREMKSLLSCHSRPVNYPFEGGFAVPSAVSIYIVCVSIDADACHLFCPHRVSTS